MKQIAALLVLLGTPLTAQDLRYSEDATVACIYAAPTQAGQRVCIGQSAQACMSATSDGGTTVGMGGCLDRELQYWDGRLNVAYRALMKKAKRVDSEMAGSGATVPKLEPALRQMQRDWIPWRDATCDFERAQWGGGTGGGPATLSCLMRLTGEQALYLETVWIGD